jgi:hypothetical protein
MGILASPRNIPRLQEALPSISNATLLSAGTGEDIPLPDSLTKENLIALLSSPSLPTDSPLPWPDIDNPPPSAATFSFYEQGGKTFIEGAQVINKAGNAVFFHSRVKAAGVEEWKLRVLEEGQEDDKIRVTETVWGSAPWWVVGYLWVSGLATRVHREHMEKYGDLLGRE